ncbi:MATE family efflux transporter [Mucilaginibacter myungsuensis]|uniref:Multidrug-efflux transporter n=1 Tax=Mucilaginibacter myungsuensis TaxID=649104 RepID=A0A929KS16_9SPHI|nr:MATE family efflux transporter [Mucilaginibacter myungsuensis]MBE9660444.1 MATE family efflux transporter [Mucilaginibacter myungsuensis]MDN3600486.1 MATE family efflux transporter [Mucilaginibacter myungsuensis]
MKALYQKYKPFYQDNLKLAIPVVISQAGHVLTHVSDSVVVGHFAGTIALAGVSLGNNVFMILMVLGLGLSYGITPLIAQHNGRENYAECGRLLSNSLFINLSVAILTCLLIFLGIDKVLASLHQSPEVIEQAKPFLKLLAISFIPMLIFNTFKQFAEGLGFTKQAMQISIWGNVLNIILGVIFVKGMFGIKPMGIVGVGYSTLIDRCIMAILMGVFVFRSPRFKVYLENFSLRFIEWARSLQLLKIGIPVALQYFFEAGAFSAAGIIIGTISPIAQAAHQVALSMASLTYIMASGIAAATAIKSGNYFGAGDPDGLRSSAISSYHIVIAFMSITALIFALGNSLIPWIYTEDKAVIAIAAQLFIIAAFFQLFDGTQVVGLGILRGMGDVNIPTFITLFAYWVVGLPIGYFVGIYLGLGANGIWYGLTLGLMVSSLLLFFRFQFISKKMIRQKPTTETT